MKQNFRKLIGNDIVDLVAAKSQSNWQRKGYTTKIFTPGEQSFITNAENPDHMVWLLWSMKEAAYKINSKHCGIRNYAPLRLQCDLQQLSANHAEGMVRVNDHSYYTRSTIETTRVHTICASTKGELSDIRIKISIIADCPDFDYHATKPQCVSHHGAYLALAYL